LIGTVFFICWLCASYIFFRRYPESFSQPNFYAEDGSVFTDKLIDHGFLSSILTTFNGYFIWGIYLVTQLGVTINSLLFGGEFVQIAKSLAVASYLFLGFVTVLPVFLFRKYFPLVALVLISIFMVFVPLQEYDYAVIGTIGNLKFGFIFLGFILLVYRHLMPSDSKKVYLVDLGILIAAYTNITVYAFMPFALIKYLPDMRTRKGWKKLFSDRSFRSLVALSILLLPQLAIIALKGVPPLTGYMDGAFNYSRTIEIFVARSYLYGMVFPVYKYLSDPLVILAFIATIVLLVVSAKKSRLLFVFGLYAVLLSTLLFVVKRTGVSELYAGYKNSGPDQFFYAQNWIIYFVIGITLAELIRKLKPKHQYTAVLSIALVFFVAFVPKAGTYGESYKNTGETIGNIYANAQKACKQDSSTLDLAVYPIQGIYFEDIPRDALCTSRVTGYKPESLSLGLVPFENNYISELGSKNSFTQTFVSPYGNLSGISVFFSTFTRKVNSKYSLSVYDSSCNSLLTKTSIDTGKIKDNSFYTIDIPNVKDSDNKTYCFKISPDQDNPQALAVQLSQAGIYLDGQTIVNGQSIPEDIVFRLNYE
jgi:hypothetical protein